MPNYQRVRFVQRKRGGNTSEKFVFGKMKPTQVRGLVLKRTSALAWAWLHKLIDNLNSSGGNFGYF